MLDGVLTRLLACTKLRERSLVARVFRVDDVEFFGFGRGGGGVLGEGEGKDEELEEGLEDGGPARAGEINYRT